MNINYQFTKNDWALPLRVAVAKTPSYWIIGIHLLCFSWNFLHVNVPKKELIEAPETAAPYEPEPIKPTKAYADQRQKSRRNRRRKPSKAMKNLYQLS